MKTTNLVILLFFSPFFNLLYAQQDTLYGHLIDGELGEELIGGLTCTPSCETGAVSDIDGYYALPITDRNQEVQPSYDGCLPFAIVPKTAYKLDALLRPYRRSDFPARWYQWRVKKAIKKEIENNSFIFKGILLDTNNQPLTSVPILLNGKEIAQSDANGKYEITTTNDIDGIVIFYPVAYAQARFDDEKIAVEAVLVKK